MDVHQDEDGETEGTYLVGDSSTHTSDQDNAAAVPEAGHLSPGCLRSKEDAIHVDVHDLDSVSVRKSVTR